MGEADSSLLSRNGFRDIWRGCGGAALFCGKRLYCGEGEVAGEVRLRKGLFDFRLRCRWLGLRLGDGWRSVTSGMVIASILSDKRWR
nr:hypothetical protein CFP56_11445 [Quercus suber]